MCGLEMRESESDSEMAEAIAIHISVGRSGHGRFGYGLCERVYERVYG